MVTPVQRYLVGGCVRDRLLGLPVRDRDWVVVGETADTLVARGYQRVGSDFPVFLDATGEEHALARIGWGVGSSFHPAATVEDDLQHRDLTINAIAMDADGAIVDPVGGVADLRAKVLRHVGPSFAEDPIRVMRAARFAARLPEFTIAPETMALMADITARGELDAVTPERVWLELDKALSVDRPSTFFLVLRQCGALQRLLPEIDDLFGVPQPPAHHPEVDSGLHTMMVVDTAARLTVDRAVRFAALVHDLGKGSTPREEWPRHIGHEARGASMVGPLVRRLAGPNAYSELGALAARLHITVARAAELRPGTLLEVLEAADAFHRPERLDALLLVCEADARGRLGHEDDDFPQAALLRQALAAATVVTAKQLIAQGVEPSPRLGEILFQRRAEAVRAALRDR